MNNLVTINIILCHSYHSLELHMLKLMQMSLSPECVIDINDTNVLG